MMNQALLNMATPPARPERRAGFEKISASKSRAGRGAHAEGDQGSFDADETRRTGLMIGGLLLLLLILGASLIFSGLI